MIVDWHVHIWEPGVLRERRRRDPAVERHCRRMEEIGERFTGRQIDLCDARVELLVEEMARAGVDKAVVHWMDGVGFLDTPADYVYRAVKRYPDKLIPFVAVDPRQGKIALDAFERHVHDGAARGLALVPFFGFYPNDPDVCYPFYEKACGLGVPVSIHIGGITPSGMRAKYGRPLYLDDVAEDFPDLVLVAENIGAPWYDELYAVATARPNVYATLAAIGGALAHTAPNLLWQELSKIKMMLGCDRVLYASDWPSIPSMEELVAFLRSAPFPDLFGALGLPAPTPDDRQAILGANAARLLHLESG